MIINDAIYLNNNFWCK